MVLCVIATFLALDHCRSALSACSRYGIGTGVWDVAMNVQGAEVERRLGRSIMPRFMPRSPPAPSPGRRSAYRWPRQACRCRCTSAWSVVLAVVLSLRGTRSFLPAEEEAPRPSSSGSAWLEPRTLAVGLMVLTFAVAEGSANDWLSLAIIDGYDERTGASAATRCPRDGHDDRPPPRPCGAGPLRAGRVLWASAGGRGCGHPADGARRWARPLAAVGIVVWGLGASLGFPVGMSAAADDPVRSAASGSASCRVRLRGVPHRPAAAGRPRRPGRHPGRALSLTVLMIPAALTVFAARPARRPRR